tara:strand:- start:617 stop:1348 length:732 start_codon:yes stop_codon:yes gene_type:complete
VAKEMSNNSKLDIDLELNKLARGYRIVAANGHLEATLGHLSWRDPKRRGLWMKCQERGLDEVEPGDLHLINWDGKVLEGSKGHRHSEWPIHAAVYKARKDVHCVGHTHPMHCVLFSATNENLVGIGHNGSYFGGKVKVFEKTLALVRSMEDASAMATALGDAWAVLLRNHGVTFCGNSIEHCVVMGIAIEQACKEQLIMNGTGLNWEWKVNSGLKDEAILYPRIVKNLWLYHNRKLDRAESRL